MTDRLAAALLAEALGLPRQPPPQPPLNLQLSPAERAEVADRELRLRAELARQAASRAPNSDPNPDPNPRPHPHPNPNPRPHPNPNPNPNPNQAEAAEEQRAEHARGMGELQREVRKLGKQADEYEVRRANLERAAEQLTLSLSLGLSLSLSLSLGLSLSLSLSR